MMFDSTMKVIMAVAGLVGGLAQAFVNGKTLVMMAKSSDSTEESNTESAESQSEEV